MRYLALFTLLLCTLGLSGQEDFPDLDKSVMDAAYYPQRAALRSFAETDEERTAMEPKIRVLYSRPLKNDREIFGDLLPYGEPWRAGANESTEVFFFQDVTVGDQLVPAGRYSLIVIPTESEWTVKLNSELDGWGNFSYDPAADVASISVPVQELTEPVEAVSMVLYEASPGTVHLKMGWDRSFVEVPIEVN